MNIRLSNTIFVVTLLFIASGMFTACQEEENELSIDYSEMKKYEVKIRDTYLNQYHKDAIPVYDGVYVFPDETQSKDEVKDAIQDGDNIEIYYEGYLFYEASDGVQLKSKPFDGNFIYTTGENKGAPFQLKIVDLEKNPNVFTGIISGFQIALCHMHVGERAKVVIPSRHGYGMHGAGLIGPFQTLVFFIEVKGKVK
ncbi:FKBP-type peptidyl-prolyl cis-trans isomerase [Prolixibacteraceae bacterium]|nr:FKBP-type peptidyl-prolyl cis-trans isomerase [Prolixibacteraceae bacterium]